MDIPDIYGNTPYGDGREENSRVDRIVARIESLRDKYAIVRMITPETRRGLLVYAITPKTVAIPAVVLGKGYRAVTGRRNRGREAEGQLETTVEE